jgi:hypothetical protein
VSNSATLVQMISIPTQKSFLNLLTHSDDDGFRFRSTRVSISTLHAAESADSVLERAQNVHHAKCSTTDLLAYLCLPDAALSLSLSLSLSLPTARALARLLDSGAARAIPAA